ncbi:hypothetical protein BDV97DRAFT_396191 [Delphinella strobiligena]|nr:hypothetical protein BDV97DRAFT_396191 [Delphinella strobiligena]
MSTQAPNPQTTMDNPTELSGELLGEADEPPERRSLSIRSPSPRLDAAFIKSLPPAFARRESLLTRQLNFSEPEHTEDEHHRARSMIRGMSTWSNLSVASTASLTSDNDLTSPGTRDSTPSPPLAATLIHTPVPGLEKAHHNEPIINGRSLAASPEQTVEAGLGRRRCITFACGRKPSSDQADTSPEKEKPRSEQKAADTPKRKPAITFACPARPTIQTSPSQQRVKTARNTSPAPARVSRPPPSPKQVLKAHRGSDSTVKNDSPKSLRKIPSNMMRRRKYSDDNNDVPAEERRFHEFGPIQSEAEQWLEESTCHRNRLTVNDTLIKETLIRRIGEEVEEEALEDEEDFDEEDMEDEDDEDEDEEDDDVDEGASDDAVSDAGFQTDDEDGFAVSDSENDDDSDNEWWTAGRSTAATSTEHLDHLRLSPRRRSNSQSSMESGSGDVILARPPQGKVRRKTKSITIHRPGTPDLPDSTDFVCGTLDEDRPLEQAYISCLEQRKAAKHKARPQDIDPTFPTSDPEMDEEDDDSESDHGEVDESDHPGFLHGNLDLNNEDSDRRGRLSSITGTKKKSPSPAHQRLRSPPPSKRAVHRSPPPAKRVTHKSPPPPKRSILKSPPPAKRTKSPAPPRRLFGDDRDSPKKPRSPQAASRRIASPPPSRRTSLNGSPGISFTPRADLAQRPQPTHTASLPRVASTLKLGRHIPALSFSEHDEALPMTTRGAIDIVKGLEKKRQRRREKLYQKHCNRAGKDREHKKPKPGKGAERMREVGLELAAYKGKKEHMLSY